MKSAICIISAYRPDLMGEAVQSLGAVGNFEVIMDRRQGERRQSQHALSDEARCRDRRQRDIEELLRTEGFAIVPRD